MAKNKNNKPKNRNNDSTKSIANSTNSVKNATTHADTPDDSPRRSGPGGA